MPKKDKSSAGRFGPRYGRVARENVAEIEKFSRDSHECPSCGSDSVKRKSSGIWLCKKCGNKFAGGAYKPETSTGETVKRALTRAKERAEEEL